ncbi:MAG: hypothetical protein QNJ64_01540 [Crocosphaera sp.]|nr:hypothetical protein [Crocosphaera sp.]
MFNTLTQFSKIALGCFFLGMSGLMIVPSSLAEPEIITDPKPLEVYTGTVQDLEGTVSNNPIEELAVGGEYPPLIEIPSLEPNKNSLEAKTEALNQTLENHDNSLGDVQRPTYRVPLVNF